MGRDPIHAPDGGLAATALCKQPTGDISTVEGEVDCIECLDELAKSERTFEQPSVPADNLEADRVATSVDSTRERAAEVASSDQAIEAEADAALEPTAENVAEGGGATSSQLRDLGQEVGLRLDVLDRRLKVAAVLVAVLGLAAPAFSAFAAYQSWRVAEGSMALQRAALETSGANLYVDHEANAAGECDSSSDPLRLEVAVLNWGRLSGGVKSLRLYVRVGGGGGTPGQDLAMTQLIPVSEEIEPFQVPAQDSTILSIPLNCEKIKEAIRPADMLQGVIPPTLESFIRGSQRLVAYVDMTMGGLQSVGLDVV